MPRRDPMVQLYYWFEYIYMSNPTIIEKLSPDILLSAYSQGYFPMPDGTNKEILWFRPDPRAILPLDQFHISRSLRRKLNKKNFLVTFNEEFRNVMLGCASHPDTWINRDILDSYSLMHQLGFAHSVEVWMDGKLAGGTYGLAIGGAFFAESMFHYQSDASKIALFNLVERLKEKRYMLLECQFMTAHLESLGAISVSDSDYMKTLKKALTFLCDFDG